MRGRGRAGAPAWWCLLLTACAGTPAQSPAEDNTTDETAATSEELTTANWGVGRSQPGAASRLALGVGFSCTIAANGSVKCWGLNTSGQLGEGDVITRGDGPNEMGANTPTVPFGSFIFGRSIAAGSAHVCALLHDGSVKCWGKNANGQLGLGDTAARGDGPNEIVVLPTLSFGTNRSARQIVAGKNHSCALLDNSQVKCWGANASGQLGLGDVNSRGDNTSEMGDSLPPVALGTGRTAVSVVAGGDHTCAILDNGTVKCWGLNTSGELGLGDVNARGDGPGEMGDTLLAVSLGTGRTARAVAAGDGHTCALLDNDTVKCWGKNNLGQLGQGDVNARGDAAGEMGDSLPAIVLGSSRTARQITAGTDHTCALLDDGTAKCWGGNATGQLGLGNALARGDGAGEMGDSLPVIQVGSGSGVREIAAGDGHTCAWLENGALRCWGKNTNGQLGLDDVRHRGDNANEMGDNLPVVSMNPSVGEATDLRHKCAVVADATVRCWGNNDSGQLGLGDTNNRGDGAGEMATNLPVVQLGGGRTARTVVTGLSHSCALLDTGSVKCWGKNQFGQLGLGDNLPRGDGPGEMGDSLNAVSLGTGRTAIALFAGNNSACALLDNKSLKCWGENASGQLGLGDTNARGDAAGEMGDALPAVSLGTGRTAIYVKIGGSHACALLDNATVKCWGSSFFGECGYEDKVTRGDGAGEMGDSLPAVSLGTGRTAKALAVGGLYNCALLDNGTVKCWGFGGLLGDGDGVIRGDGVGEMGDNLPVVSLATGRFVRELIAYQASTCALFDNAKAQCWGSNTSGDLGLGDTNERGDQAGEMGDSLPFVPFGTNRTPAAIVGYGCALLDSGALQCWGPNANGQLGQGDTIVRGDNAGEMGDNLPTIRLGAPQPVLTLASLSGDHTCVVLAGGLVKCWGWNAFGQLGLGDTNNRGDNANEMDDNLPVVQLGANRFARKVATANQFTCALLDTGNVKCWGTNVTGELGQGDKIARGDNAGEMGDSLPIVPLGTSRTAQDLVAGIDHVCALLDNGTVKCWGNNSFGQLGLGDTNHRGDQAGEMGDSLPAVSLGTGRVARAIAAAGLHTCALLDNGAVKCWGLNSAGQLGLGDTNTRGDGAGEMGDSLPAVALGTGRLARALATGGNHTCAILDDGNVKCWGANTNGQLGLGDTNHRGDGAGEMGDSLPTVALGSNGGVPFTAITLAAGNNHTCAILLGSFIKCWGLNSSGQLGLGDTNSRGDNAGEMGDNLSIITGIPGQTLEVVAGNGHTCALTAYGSSLCWGSNNTGQLGLGDVANRGDNANEMTNLGKLNLGDYL